MAATHRVSAVIFDLDGTLLDTGTRIRSLSSSRRRPVPFDAPPSSVDVSYARIVTQGFVFSVRGGMFGHLLQTYALHSKITICCAEALPFQ